MTGNEINPAHRRQKGRAGEAVWCVCLSVDVRRTALSQRQQDPQWPVCRMHRLHLVMFPMTVCLSAWGASQAPQRQTHQHIRHCSYMISATRGCHICTALSSPMSWSTDTCSSQHAESCTVQTNPPVCLRSRFVRSNERKRHQILPHKCSWMRNIFVYSM